MWTFNLSRFCWFPLMELVFGGGANGFELKRGRTSAETMLCVTCVAMEMAKPEH